MRVTATNWKYWAGALAFLIIFKNFRLIGGIVLITLGLPTIYQLLRGEDVNMQGFGFIVLGMIFCNWH